MEILFSCLTSVKEKKMQTINKKILVLITLITLLFSGCSSLDEEDLVTKKDFKNNVELICRWTGSTYSNATLVKKSKGWSLYKNHYFRKGEQLMNVRNCSSKVKEFKY